ncbi:MAG: hypothetical protein ABJE95_04405 [Byssovorax sp.]
MKTKLRTMLLAAAGVLGSVAVAQAQPAPEPPPAPAPAPVAPAAAPPAAAAPGAPVMQPAAPPVAPPPVAPQPVAPAEPPPVAAAGMPAAPPPVAAAPVNWGGAPPTPDAVQGQDPPKKPNPWGFTRFTWNNSGSTKIFGVGGRYIGTEDEAYTMDFGLNVRYSFLNEANNKAYVNLAGGVEVELTNSDTTLRKREPLLRDTSIGVGYSHTLFQTADKETKTSWLIAGGLSLPTSKASQRIGKYLGTSLTTGIIHGQKLAGAKSDWFPDVLIFATINWGHSFTRATTATNEDLFITAIPRQVACDGGGACVTDVGSDQIGSGFLTHDRLKLNATYYLSIYKDVVSFGNSWEIEQKFKYSDTPDTCQPIATGGCATVGHQSLTPTTRNVATTFDASVSYAIPQNLGRVDLGYVNTTGQLAENSTYRSVFFSPDAQFYLNLVAYFDGIYDKAAEKKKANGTAEARKRVAELPRFVSH